MLGYLLRLLLLFLIARAIVLLVRGVMTGVLGTSRPAPGQPRPASRGTLVQDPVCGTFVLRDRALSMRTGGGDLAFFCSEGCRSAYDARAAASR